MEIVISAVRKYMISGALGNFCRELLGNRIARKYLTPYFDVMTKKKRKFRFGLALSVLIGAGIGYLSYDYLSPLGQNGLIISFLLNLGFIDLVEALIKKLSELEKTKFVESIIELIIKKEIRS